MRRRLRFALLLLLAAGATLPAQDKKPPEKKETPQVLVAIPLGVPAGKAMKVTLRGLKLDTVTEVRFPGLKVAARVLSKGKAAVPIMQDAKHVGDTQVEVEVALPADAPEGAAEFVVVAQAGDSTAHK